MLQFSLAQEQDRAALTALWSTCFGDSRAFADAFLNAASPQVFVARDGSGVISMVCALSAALVDAAGESHPAAYLYAICTAPDFRGRGLCRRLIAYTEDCLKKRGFAFTVLVPAEESLFTFYQKMGYSTVFYHNQYKISAGKGSARITPLSADGYRNLRQLQLYSDFLSYPLPLLEWQKTCSEACGGGLFRLETADMVCCAAVEKQKDTLIFKELLPDCPEAAAQLAAALHCSRALVRTEGTSRPFAMGKVLKSALLPAFAYLGLAFD